MPVSTMPEPDELFHQEFVRALFDRVVAELASPSTRSEDRRFPSLLFERYDLDAGRGRQLRAPRERVRADGDAGHQLAGAGAAPIPRARARGLRGLCGSEEEFRREARDLFGLEVDVSVRALSDAAVTRLRTLGRWPEFESGRYSVIEEIGRGGMGTVYLAVDDELGREVAIKIPNALAQRRSRAAAAQRSARPRAPRASRHRADPRRRPPSRRPPVLRDEACQGSDAARSRDALSLGLAERLGSSNASASRSRSLTRTASSIATSSRRTSWSAHSAK